MREGLDENPFSFLKKKEKDWKESLTLEVTPKLNLI